jgi:hypothetical protein
MDGRRPSPTESAAVLDSRIERLELEGRDAVRRRDWSAARSIALERVGLLEARRKGARGREAGSGRSRTKARRAQP